MTAINRNNNPGHQNLIDFLHRLEKRHTPTPPSQDQLQKVHEGNGMEFYKEISSSTSNPITSFFGFFWTVLHGSELADVKKALKDLELLGQFKQDKLHETESNCTICSNLSQVAIESIDKNLEEIRKFEKPALEASKNLHLAYTLGLRCLLFSFGAAYTGSRYAIPWLITAGLVIGVAAVALIGLAKMMYNTHLVTQSQESEEHRKHKDLIAHTKISLSTPNLEGQQEASPPSPKKPLFDQPPSAHHKPNIMDDCKTDSDRDKVDRFWRTKVK